MYGLPESTEVGKVLPKKTVIDKFGLAGQERSRFDSTIHHIVISNEVSLRTVNLSSGSINGFFVLKVELHDESYDQRLIQMLFRLIPQNMVMILECGPRCRPVVFKEVLIEGQWMLRDSFNMTMDGLNIDDVWENIILQVGEIVIDEGNDLQSQISIDEERRKREIEISRLEKKMASEKQPRKRKEIFDKIRELRCHYRSV